MHELLSPSFERNDERGLFREVLNEGQWEALICGRMKAGAVLGNHYHMRTMVFFYLTSGAASIKTIHIETGERDQFTLQANQGVFLRTNESHAIYFLKESDFVMLKSHRYDPADPDTFHFPVPE